MSVTEITPHLRRWMLFVDGENLTLRGEAFAKTHGFQMRTGRFYEPGVFVWPPWVVPTASLLFNPDPATAAMRPTAIRASYYTAIIGGNDDKLEIIE
jgi:hypothetical protein